MKKTTTYAGIDYGLGKTNVDTKTGIRYGVISQHSIMPECLDEFEPHYAGPNCPKCGADVIRADEFNPDDVQGDDIEDAHDLPSYGRGCTDYVCITCAHSLDSSEVWAEESDGFEPYTKDGYKIESCLDTDLFVIESPFYTYAQFCSPCVPGAGNLDNPLVIGECRIHEENCTCTREELDAAFQRARGRFERSYALGHDWFENGRAPYRVFRVSDGSEVMPESAQ